MVIFVYLVIDLFLLQDYALFIYFSHQDYKLKKGKGNIYLLILLFCS